MGTQGEFLETGLSEYIVLRSRCHTRVDSACVLNVLAYTYVPAWFSIYQHQEDGGEEKDGGVEEQKGGGGGVEEQKEGGGDADAGGGGPGDGGDMEELGEEEDVLDAGDTDMVRTYLS